MGLISGDGIDNLTLGGPCAGSRYRIAGAIFERAAPVTENVETGLLCIISAVLEIEAVEESVVLGVLGRRADATRPPKIVLFADCLGSMFEFEAFSETGKIVSTSLVSIGFCDNDGWVTSGIDSSGDLLLV